MHISLEHKEINTVQKYVSSDTCTRTNRDPLPEIILRIEAKVDDNNRGHTHDDNHYSVDSEEKSVDMVDLVVPKGREYVVELDEDGTEGKEAGKGYEVGWFAIPWDGFRYGTGNGVDTAGEVIVHRPSRIGVAVSSDEGSNNTEWCGDEDIK